MKNDDAQIKWLAANWPAPPHVHAGTTMRSGGVSVPPYDQLNLGMHVNDEQDSVLVNRELMRKHLRLPIEPTWLNQIHGNNIIQLDSRMESILTNQTADGSYSNQENNVCVVMTADCLPLLLCNDDGTQIAAVHISWRGFCKDIVDAALDKFTCPNDQLMAWLGPCICPEHYETGSEVRNACLAVFSDAEDAFTPSKPGHWQTDIHKLLTLYLKQQGLQEIYGEQRCTYHENEKFFSYRKNKNTGRMASLIWVDSNKS